MLAIFMAGAVMVWVFYEFGRDLPDYRQLANYEPAVMSRVYAGDGRLIEEYAVEGRVFVPFSAIPKSLVNAFLSAEDKTFYSHPGLDFFGIARAVLTNFESRFTDRRMVGASTITQQVAKNFLLTNEYSFDRKIKEAILALRIEQAFDKDQILELYLNEIYFGSGSYGVSAAAVNYFNKSLDELSLSEAAFLAGLPKAPNNYHPIRRPQAAAERRNYVLSRMVDDGHISRSEANLARQETIIVRQRDNTEAVKGGQYFAEDVRRELINQYGSTALYEGGLAVRTSLEPDLQSIADKVLRAGLVNYDRRHGWRGPVERISVGAGWAERLSRLTIPPGALDQWSLAVVRRVKPQSAELVLSNGSAGQIQLSDVLWAREWRKDQKLGSQVERMEQVLLEGDVILVESLTEKNSEGVVLYSLRQIPDVGGAIVALDPHTGRVLAITGGFSYELSEFNRATQAKRQPGSSFKPFVYLAALDNGYTPSTLVLDAPFVIDQGPGLPKWKPRNYTGRYYGESTIRTGIEKSQNLMTVRLAQAIGMDTISGYAKRFGLVEEMPANLSAALGSQETTLLNLTAAYAMLVNGGKKITPSLIDRVQDRNGKTITRIDNRDCSKCDQLDWETGAPPELPDLRQQLTDPASAYQMVSILQGAVDRGTGRSVSAVGKPLAGKTGTTNDSFDSWFLGFSPDLAVGVFVGFDEPRTLGSNETGGTVAAPIFRDFMAEALADKPATPFRIPPNIVLVRVTPDTGLLAPSGTRNAILEAFKPGTVPAQRTAVVGSEPFSNFGNSPSDQPSAGGLY
jgi:penicillin-binding protein 1A